MQDVRNNSELASVKTIAEGIKFAAEKTPDKIAIKHGDRHLTYALLSTRIDQAAYAALSDPLLQREDTVAIIAKNCIEYVEITCGLPNACHPVATISPKLSAREISSICNDSKAKILFVDKAGAKLVKNAKFETVKRIIELGSDFESWLATGDTDAVLPKIDDESIWTIPYTSGTTGQPKGVMIPHRSRVGTCFGAAQEYGCFEPSDRFLAFAPMNHGAGIIFSLAPLFFGGYVELLDHFNPEMVLKRLKEGEATAVFMVPTHFHGIFQLDDAVLEKYRAPLLQTIISNAAPLPQSTKEKIVAYFGEGMLNETYGSTEGGIVSNLKPVDQLRKTKCVGTAFPNTSVKILNSEGGDCAPHEVGELYSTSPYLFKGYWQKPEETAKALQDGWLTVGDMAMFDEDGYIYIVDRKKDMVISGGINIYPREIEEVLLAQCDILDAAVIGVPDDKWGERLKAFVVCSNPQVLETERFKEYMMANLAGYKIPKDYECLDVIERNAAGKVIKDVLRNR